MDEEVDREESAPATHRRIRVSGEYRHVLKVTEFEAVVPLGLSADQEVVIVEALVSQQVVRDATNWVTSFEKDSLLEIERMAL